VGAPPGRQHRRGYRRLGPGVIDVDTPDGGRSLERLDALGLQRAPTLVGLTGSGGRHLVDATGTTELHNTAGGLPGVGEPLPDIDLRAHGGYNVVAPRVHVSGTRCRWEGPARGGARTELAARRGAGRPPGAEGPPRRPPNSGRDPLRPGRARRSARHVGRRGARDPQPSAQPQRLCPRPAVRRGTARRRAGRGRAHAGGLEHRPRPSRDRGHHREQDGRRAAVPPRTRAFSPSPRGQPSPPARRGQRCTGGGSGGTGANPTSTVPASFSEAQLCPVLTNATRCTPSCSTERYPRSSSPEWMTTSISTDVDASDVTPVTTEHAWNQSDNQHAQADGANELSHKMVVRYRPRGHAHGLLAARRVPR